MEEPVGAQYAIHIALHTLRDRCKSLQHRVATLEEENLSLRVQCSKSEESELPSEVDKLKRQIAELAESKQHLVNKVKMVSIENQELWTKLSRLTHANQNLGSQLTKINDSLVQYSKNRDHSPLIRSKTFTQSEPQTKVLQRNIEENGKICAELEEISLKIISSFAQGKSELDSLYSEIADMQYMEGVISDSCGFYYDSYDNIMESFTGVLNELKITKDVVTQQKAALRLILDKLHKLQEIKSKNHCDNQNKDVEMADKGTCTEAPIEVATPPVEPSLEVDDKPTEECDMICPVCCKNFASNIGFQEFQVHVENHFQAEDAFELL